MTDYVGAFRQFEMLMQALYGSYSRLQGYEQAMHQCAQRKGKDIYYDANDYRRDYSRNSDLWDRERDTLWNVANQIEPYVEYFERAELPSLTMGLELVRVATDLNPPGSKEGHLISLHCLASNVRDRLANYQPRNADECLGLASWHIERKQADRALQVLRAGCREFHDSRIKYRLMDLLDQTGNTDELAGLLREEIERSPGNLEPKKRMAQQLIKAGRSSDAYGSLEKELEKRPNDVELCCYLATLLAQGNQIARGVATLERQRQRSPENTQIRHQLADLLERAGRTDELLALLREDLSKAGVDPALRQRIARQLLSAERGEEAFAFIQEEWKKRPDDWDLRISFAGLLIEATRFDRAVVLLTERKHIRAEKPLAELFGRNLDVTLRCRVLRAIVDIRGSAMLPTLRKGLTDSAPAIRACAAEAIGRVCGPEISKELAAALRAERDSAAKATILDALSKVDTKPRTLLETLTGQRPWVK